MSAIVRSIRHLGPPQLAVLALSLAACATAVQQDIDDDTGGGGPQSSKGGSAGSATTAGTNGIGGTPPAGTSGSAPAAGSGGKVSSGGAPPATAGTTAAAGTTATAGTTSTCPPYAGTLAQDSAIFVAGFGTSTMGAWSGYGYTFKYGTATIAPGMGNSCFAGMQFCANGSVPADDMSGAGLGWNIGQVLGSMAATKVAITTPVKITFAGVAADMRVQLSASATISYCYTLTAAEATAGTATIPFASFKTACWGTTGLAYDGATPIESIQLVIPGSAAAAAKTFDVCVLDVEPG